MKSYEAVIAGAGISGLSAAWYLKDREILILEKQSRPGGRICTRKQGGYLLEDGPSSLLTRNFAIRKLIEDASLKEELLYPHRFQKARFIGKDYRLIPAGPGLIFSELTDWKSRWALLKGASSQKTQNHNETVYEFFSRKLSSHFADHLIVPFVSGVYAGDARKLIMRSSFSKLYEWDQKFNSLLLGAFLGEKEPNHPIQKGLTSFRGGLSFFTDSLASQLGEKIRLNSEILSLEFKDGWVVRLSDEEIFTKNLIVTMPALELIKILPETHQELKNLLAKIHYPWLKVVHLAYERSDVPMHKDGFGFLNMQTAQTKILGCLFSSNLFEGRCPATQRLYTCFVGGSLHENQRQDSDSRIVSMVHEELAKTLGIRTSGPCASFVCEWAHSIPQYDKNHLAFYDWLNRLEGNHQGLWFATNYAREISIPGCIKNAMGIALQIQRNIQRGKS